MSERPDFSDFFPESDLYERGGVDFLHADFLQIVKEYGIEEQARDSGILREGQLAELKEATGKLTSPRSRDLLSYPHLPLSPNHQQRAALPTVDKGNKGLRHFSQKVCECVEFAQQTTYNEVADLLLSEYPDDGNTRKNIRRRVYDVLNVLYALDVIKKEKKTIRWIGLAAQLTPLNSEDTGKSKAELASRISEKSQHLQSLQEMYSLYTSLSEQNRRKPKPQSFVRLPFIVIHTPSHCRINIQTREGKSWYSIEFSLPMNLIDDQEGLRSGLIPRT